MKNLTIKKNIFLLTPYLFAFLTFYACTTEPNEIQFESTSVMSQKSDKLHKVTVCHKGYHISISKKAINAHRNHGDAVDFDDDGYYDLENDCSNDIDCDDTNATINPESEEICDNGIDDNCDGNIDEGCAQVGDLRDGGIVFYIAESGEDLNADGIPDRGLVSALSDITDISGNDTVVWGCVNTTIGVTSTEIGTGAQNTKDIITGCPTMGIAADLCDNYSIIVDGITYDDWFLPSKDELYEMYLKVGQGSGNNLGNFGNVNYWSSTEYSSRHAYLRTFTTGEEWGVVKSVLRHARAVRVF